MRTTHRLLHDHKVNPANEKLHIEVLDAPGDGGASHWYRISGYDLNHEKLGTHWSMLPDDTDLIFQNGPIGEVGVNGITHEALLAVLIDRLRGFQSGAFACRENALALTKLEEAMHWLHHRTRARIVRGVEGTHER